MEQALCCCFGGTGPQGKYLVKFFRSSPGPESQSSHTFLRHGMTKGKGGLLAGEFLTNFPFFKMQGRSPTAQKAFKTLTGKNDRLDFDFFKIRLPWFACARDGDETHQLSFVLRKMRFFSPPHSKRFFLIFVNSLNFPKTQGRLCLGL